MHVEDRLKKIRKLTGLNQIEFAEKHGISSSAYKNYERGFQQPPFSLAMELCETYGISPKFLLLGKGPMYEQDNYVFLLEAQQAVDEFEKEEGLVLSEDKKKKLIQLALLQIEQNADISLTEIKRTLNLAS